MSYLTSSMPTSCGTIKRFQGNGKCRNGATAQAPDAPSPLILNTATTQAWALILITLAPKCQRPARYPSPGGIYGTSPSDVTLFPAIGSTKKYRVLPALFSVIVAQDLSLLQVNTPRSRRLHRSSKITLCIIVQLRAPLLHFYASETLAWIESSRRKISSPGDGQHRHHDQHDQTRSRHQNCGASGLALAPDFHTVTPIQTIWSVVSPSAMAIGRCRHLLYVT
jgi:hypothetical protein